MNDESRVINSNLAIHDAVYLLHVIVILMWLQLQLKQKKANHAIKLEVNYKCFKNTLVKLSSFSIFFKRHPQSRDVEF